MFLWICCFIILLILYIRYENYEKNTIKIRNLQELLCQEFDNNLNIPNKNQMENRSEIPGMWMTGKNDTVAYFEIKNDESIIINFKL